MVAMTIRNIPEELHRALKLRAAQNNRSAEAEVRALMEEKLRPEARLKLGTALAAISRDIGLTNADIEALQELRTVQPAEPLRFE
jgi:plasmid stability protein